VRPLRIDGVYQIVGAALFAAVLIAAWILGAGAMATAQAERQRLALAGALFVMPWALIVLLWVGIGAPFQATPTENHMRFLLLLANSILVTSAFVVLKEQLGDAGERFYSTLGFVVCIPAGVSYLGCMSLMSAAYVATLRDGQAVSLGLLSDVFDVLEFTACVLTYVATAAFAMALAQTRLLGRGAARAYVIVCGILVLLLVIRGVSYPEMNLNSSPWYLNVTWIAGIPAIPWIMPCLLGVVLLKRAGEFAIPAA
jgi:cytochrome bd-type quinol oxidase subunit 2